MAQGQSNSDFSKTQTKKKTKKRLITTFTRSFGLFWTGHHDERLSHFSSYCMFGGIDGTKKKKKIKMFALISTIIIINNNIL